MFLLQFDFNMCVFKSISKSLKSTKPWIQDSSADSKGKHSKWAVKWIFILPNLSLGFLTLPLLLPCNQLLWKQYIVPKVSLEKSSPMMHPLDKSSFSQHSVHKASARCAHLQLSSNYQFPCIVPQALHVHWNTTRSSHLSRLSGRHAWERLPRSRSGVYSAYGSSVPHSSKRRR